MNLVLRTCKQYRIIIINSMKVLSNLLYSGSTRSCLFLRLSFVGSENLKNAGANSTSQRGSMAVLSLMYSLVVRISS